MKDKCNQRAFVSLQGHYNQYSWGKMGHNSEVARLFHAGHAGFQIEADKPYSELWMGTHPDGPATLMDNRHETLSKYIAYTENTNNGPRETTQKERHLPFIMKVMSIEQTLSLQVHPTKSQAARLHKTDPLNYPDRNHKPELAYALTKFQLLCGFRPAHEMLANLKAFRSLRILFGPGAEEFVYFLSQQDHSAQMQMCTFKLKACFAHMMNFHNVDGLIRELFNELDSGIQGAISPATLELIKRIGTDFPGDVGVFSPLYLNHMILEPGECCYYAAEELHAYINGECVECVGCSNNTIRAAMTPKFIDRKNLIEILNYQMTDPMVYMVYPKTMRKYKSVDEYSPDCKDFQLHRIRVKRGDEKVSLPPLDCGSIMVVHSGRAVLQEQLHYCADNTSFSAEIKEVKRGDILYIHRNKRIRFLSCSEDLEAFRTFSFEEGPDHENRNIVRVRHLNGIDFEPVSELGYSENLSGSRESGIFEVEAEMDGFF